jgi:hypothetical protein
MAMMATNLPSAFGVDAPADKIIAVTIDNFTRAENLYFGRTVHDKGIDKLDGSLVFTPIDKQTVMRMTRDTLYSSGVFDLDSAPVTVNLPDPASG